MAITADQHLSMKTKFRDLPTFVSTKDAAASLNRNPETLRRWAYSKTGPLEPIRINGRLAWRVEDLAAILKG
jgi:hypothetical protein